MRRRWIFITGDAESADDAGFLSPDVPVVGKPFNRAEIAQIIKAEASVDA